MEERRDMKTDLTLKRALAAVCGLREGEKKRG